MMKIELATIFPRWEGEIDPKRSALLAMDPDHTLVVDIFLRLGLSYIDDVEGMVSNVCLANAEEVLPAYRTVVTRSDLVDYLSSAHSGLDLDRPSHGKECVKIPETSADFWFAVEEVRQRK